MRAATRRYQARIRAEKKAASANTEKPTVPEPTKLPLGIVPYGPYPKLPRRIPRWYELTAPAPTVKELELIRRLI